MKSDNRAKAGLLQPLEIPTRKWAQVTTDLVTDLPESDGYSAIVVFVDRYTKIVVISFGIQLHWGVHFISLYWDVGIRLGINRHARELASL